MGKILTAVFETIVNGSLKINILGFRDNNL